MKIQHSELKLSSEHQFVLQSKLQLQLSQSTDAVFSQQLSEQLRAILPRTPAEPDEPEALSLEKSKAQRFQSLLILLFGDEKDCVCKPLSAINGFAEQEKSQSQINNQAASALQFFAVEHVREQEQCHFAANGKVCLADGSSRQFAVDYALKRDTEFTRAVGGAWLELQDPLVLDFGPPTVQLSQTHIEFDLDSDGQAELMRMPDIASAFLFWDRNLNGVADNGSELFGLKTGNGFAELGALDQDQNGWIDEDDEAFRDLKLWQMSLNGERVQTLAQAGVGALAVAAANTPFSLKEQGDVLGQIQASSIWLGEHAGAGTVR